jgi:cytochrome c oxidase assembly protein Cox11
MKTAPYIFALLFIGLVFYLRFNHFELPTFFLFDKTEKTKGTVTNTEWTHGVKGYRLQLVTYEFEANDSTYTDKFKAGQREGLQKIGDKILIEYSVDKPDKNEVVGYYRNQSEPINTMKLESKKEKN